MAKIPRAPTMLAVGRRRGFETTVEPDSGAIAVSSLTPTLFGTGGGGSTGLSAEGVNGAIEEGTQIVISALSGQNFGTGPTTVLFDTLSGGTNGATVTTGNPLVGSYSTTTGAFFSSDVARSGGTSVCVYNGGNPNRQLRASWTPATVVAVRYWLMCPTGRAFPDSAIGGYSSVESSYKLYWLGTQSNMAGGTDICVPTFAVGTSVAISGNGVTAIEGAGAAWERYPNGNNTRFDHFRYGDWTMVECLQDSITPTVRMNHCGATIGMQRYTKSDASNYWGNSTTQHWSHGNLPGYIRDDGYPNTYLYQADYCVKTGSGAWADVFFGNAEDIDDCTDLRHVQISSWSTSSITCTPRGVSSVDLDGWYLIIRLADNTYLPGRLIS